MTDASKMSRKNFAKAQYLVENLIQEHPEKFDGRSFQDISATLTEDIGFKVPVSSVKTIWEILQERTGEDPWKRTRRSPGQGKAAEIAALSDRISNLETDNARLSAQLEEARIEVLELKDAVLPRLNALEDALGVMRNEVAAYRPTQTSKKSKS